MLHIHTAIRQKLEKADQETQDNFYKAVSKVFETADAQSGLLEETFAFDWTPEKRRAGQNLNAEFRKAQNALKTLIESL